MAMMSVTIRSSLSLLSKHRSLRQGLGVGLLQNGQNPRPVPKPKPNMVRLGNKVNRIMKTLKKIMTPELPAGTPIVQDVRHMAE